MVQNFKVSEIWPIPYFYLFNIHFSCFFQCISFNICFFNIHFSFFSMYIFQYMFFQYVFFNIYFFNRWFAGEAGLRLQISTSGVILISLPDLLMRPVSSFMVAGSHLCWLCWVYLNSFWLSFSNLILCLLWTFYCDCSPTSQPFRLSKTKDFRMSLFYFFVHFTECYNFPHDQG